MLVNKLCIDVLLPVDILGFISSSLDGTLLEDFVSSRTTSERSLEVNLDGNFDTKNKKHCVNFVIL